ncbi:MAG: 6-phosphofructokinase [Clostridia bacterium]|nr:6-phosphofructokinase [Clostridia bacterium]
MSEQVKKFRRIGVLTSGGDAPGMNAAVRAVTRAAIQRGVEVMGIYEGYKGLHEHNFQLFTDRDVSNIINLGGTKLYSARFPNFKEDAVMDECVEICRENQIDGIVAIGGDGTFRGATDLTNKGIPCIGIPGTIDNDITSTDESIGFDTAMNTVVQMVDRLRDTCESHARCNVVEVMGRNAGYIALQTGIAVGASAIAIREIPFDPEKAIEKIKASKASGKRNFIVIVSEGVDYAESLAKRIDAETGIETKFARLAHVVRGGSPTLRDRLLASEMGEEAVRLLLDGKSDLVVCLRDSKIVSVDINYALILDRMYKDTLKPGDLDKFTPEQVESMKSFCKMRTEEMQELYDIADDISH